MSVTLTDSQWESIVTGILLGDTTGLSDTLDTIDRTNSKTRYYLTAKWLDMAAPKIENGVPVSEWPPAVTHSFISYTPFTRDFVVNFVSGQTTHYAYITVTDDLYGQVGWQELDTFFQ